MMCNWCMADSILEATRYIARFWWLETVELASQACAGRAVDEEAETERRQFLLTYVQPGLAGLMDGSVSTLAPIFATAFATQDTWTTFLVGLSASVGAGISMGFTEVASDDGVISIDQINKTKRGDAEH